MIFTWQDIAYQNSYEIVPNHMIEIGLKIKKYIKNSMQRLIDRYDYVQVLLKEQVIVILSFNGKYVDSGKLLGKKYLRYALSSDIISSEFPHHFFFIPIHQFFFIPIIIDHFYWNKILIYFNCDSFCIFVNNSHITKFNFWKHFPRIDGTGIFGYALCNQPIKECF